MMQDMGREPTPEELSKELDMPEGGHLAHLTLFGGEVHALNKTTFYFAVSVLIAVDLVQSRYQKRLERTAVKHQEASSSE